MAKLERLVSKHRGDIVTLVAYTRAARGRRARYGSVVTSRQRLVATLHDPEEQAKLLLVPRPPRRPPE